MDNETTPRLISGLKARAHDTHSELYRYLRREHRVLSNTLARHEPSWASIAAEVEAAGVMGAKDRPASPNAVRLTWRRVCRDVEAEKAVKASRRAGKGTQGVQPSRLPATWQPTPAQVPRAAPAPRQPAPPAHTVSAPATPRVLTEEARATLAALDAQLAYRDRFVNPPKRKD